MPILVVFPLRGSQKIVSCGGDAVNPSCTDHFRPRYLARTRSYASFTMGESQLRKFPSLFGDTRARLTPIDLDIVFFPLSEEPKLLGTTENALGLRPYCEANGHELIVTSDKEGADSLFQKHIVDAE